MVLSELPDDQIDMFLSLPLEQKETFVGNLIRKHYPKINQSDPYYKELAESYYSSFYVEKLYRSNGFFREKFIVTYTHTGLIRNIINELYFTDDHLITH